MNFVKEFSLYTTARFLFDFMLAIFIIQGWLIDFINHFGTLGGFKLLRERICEGGSLSVSLLAALIRYDLKENHISYIAV